MLRWCGEVLQLTSLRGDIAVYNKNDWLVIMSDTQSRTLLKKWHNHLFSTNLIGQTTSYLAGSKWQWGRTSLCVFFPVWTKMLWSVRVWLTRLDTTSLDFGGQCHLISEFGRGEGQVSPPALRFRRLCKRFSARNKSYSSFCALSSKCAATTIKLFYPCDKFVKMGLVVIF